MFRVFTISLLFLFSLCANAQQEPMNSQYMFNMLSINPAYAGSRKVMSTSCMYRQQWLGLNGAPRTIYASMDMPIKKEKLGVGMTVTNDKIGIMSQLNANLIGSYRIQVSTRATLAFGLQAGINQFNADYASIDFSKTSSSLLPDQAFSSSVNKIAPNFGTGVYYNSDKFYVGISAPKLIQNNFGAAYSSTKDKSSFRNTQSRHYFFIMGYVFKINELYTFKPSILVKEVPGAPLEIDFNSNFWIQDIVGIGLSYRSKDALVGILEFQVNPQFRFGYSYDYPLTTLIKATSGSHEILVRYEFGYGKSNIKSLRYF